MVLKVKPRDTSKEPVHSKGGRSSLKFSQHCNLSKTKGRGKRGVYIHFSDACQDLFIITALTDITTSKGNIVGHK